MMCECNVALVIPYMTIEARLTFYGIMSNYNIFMQLFLFHEISNYSFRDTNHIEYRVSRNKIL